MELAGNCLLTAAVSAAFCASGWAQWTQRISAGSGNVQGDQDSEYPTISADGRVAAFHSPASNLVPADTNATTDVFVRVLVTGSVERVSVDSTGAEANGSSVLPSLSSDGRFVAFHSWAGNLVPGDTNGIPDVFLRDRQSGTTELISVGFGGAVPDGSSAKPVVNGNGRFVVYASQASNLIQGDTNFTDDVFLRDRQTGTTERVSVTHSGAQANSSSWWASVSDDGRFVAFDSQATNLVAGDTNANWDVFVRDRQLGTTTLLSLGPASVQGNDLSVVPRISADGRLVAFQSNATNLVPQDTNSTVDVFVRDLAAGVTTRLSVDSGGVQGNGESMTTSISADGRFVAFESLATNLVTAPSNGNRQIFVRDRQLGTTRRVSVSSAGALANGKCEAASISGDGWVVAFHSSATNLVPGDTNAWRDSFVRRELPPPAVYCTAKPNSVGCVPAIAFAGTSSASSASGFVIRASLVRNQKPGLLLHGVSGRGAAPFSGGFLCIHPAVRRSVSASSNGTPLPASDCSGVYALDMNAFAAGALGGNPLPALTLEGTVVDAQWWGRDPGFAAPNNTTLSDALEYVVGI